MSGSALDQPIPPPRDGKIQKITVSTTGATTALASSVVGAGWIRVKAITANVEFYFTTNSGATPPTYGASGNSGVGYPLLAGTWEEFYITSDTYISWDAESAGLLVLCRSGAERTGK